MSRTGVIAPGGGPPYDAAALRAAFVFFVAVLAVGCGGPSLVGGVFTRGGVRYRVGDLGRAWSSIRLGDQNDLAWEHGGSHAIVQINSTCQQGSDVPLGALTNHLLIGFTQREIREQEVVPMDGREAMRTHVVAKLDGVPREMLLTVLKKDGCVYDMALLAAPGGAFEGARADYDRFVAAFATVEGR